MFPAIADTTTIKATSHKVVLPFYVYAAVSFLAAVVLLFFSATNFTQSYFHPHVLAITHIMTLGWGTMIILGASHQLVPVMIEGALYSNKLAWISFLFAAVGIPILVSGFYFFNLVIAKWGGSFVVIAVIAYIINLAYSMAKSKHENVHAVFVFTASLWLLATTVFGLLLLYNFTYPVMQSNSFDYLALHAHIGIIGWFLLLITGVGSRLIPMFLISKYNSPTKLWTIYGFINAGLLSFVFFFLYVRNHLLLLIPAVLVTAGIVLFGNFCYKAYKERLRKKVDEQMKISLFSVMLLALPMLLAFVLIFVLLILGNRNIALSTTYGFVIFFGWITAIILGMTFKTLPFIIWNKVYHRLAGKGKTPSPKDLFNDKIFHWMSLSYIAGLVVFAVGILMQLAFILKTGAALLLSTAILYNWNVLLLIKHKPSL
jgi:hypothetical protein